MSKFRAILVPYQGLIGLIPWTLAYAILYTDSGGLATARSSKTCLPLSLAICGFVTTVTPTDEKVPETLVEKDKVAR